ncbi:single-strand DNA-binding protein [Nocardioides sp. J9]|uniref:single-stranded DNA-binding protein n=1 Tax=unclassified Nocardioides TaxID=2615069 RepID=UPI0004B5BE79|nr:MULTISPECIES: single-stranded DNA-binding protein [unclassified Nocardioides]TWG97435.1 single-strand DNA-binding protein [Nocardioides sp. J9]
MANETIVTVQGWVANVPMVREVGGVPVINFRVGCTPRHYQRQSDTWVDGPTQWYGVSAWRRLATHAGASLKQGDAVVVQGRLNHRTYVNKNGVEVLAMEIDATVVGHDLTRGTSTFTKAGGGTGAAGDPGMGDATAAA